jgi:hypothetical protein
VASTLKFSSACPRWRARHCGRRCTTKNAATVAAQFAIAKVVGEHKDNVGAFSRTSLLTVHRPPATQIRKSTARCSIADDRLKKIKQPVG